MKFRDLGHLEIRVGLLLNNPQNKEIYEVIKIENDSILLRQIKEHSFYGPCSFEFVNEWRIVKHG